jgi:predicted nuclease of restriction endonuclease-like (RecB) superfamily
MTAREHGHAESGDIPQYADLLACVKAKVATARVRAGLAANTALVLAYWDIGALILRRQGEEGWGAEVIRRLSRDLRQEFSGLRGFSERNLKYMRTLAETYPVREKVQQLVAQIPWGHTLHLLHKVKDGRAREWYMRQTVEHGWSRNVLALHVDAGDYQRKGQAVTNFRRTLPDAQSDLAQEEQAGTADPVGGQRGSRRAELRPFSPLRDLVRLRHDLAPFVLIGGDQEVVNRLVLTELLRFAELGDVL